MDDIRYLVDFDSEALEREFHDVVIIGSGIAGVYTALEIPEKYNVAILTKENINISNSVLAQGGIAVPLDKEDSPELHFRDTIFAGAGLCDENSVWVLVTEAEKNIKKLCELGVNFDKNGPHQFSLSREGAHSKKRIVHVGDATGKEVCDKLISIVKTRSNIQIHERIFALDIITEGDVCKGVIAYDETEERFKIYASRIVVCATGGYGQLYSNTTNPEVATGDGVSLAYRAGAELMDLEFIQFHPTVLYHPENKSFLISEAVRGEGALLKNAEGERFMPGYHELGELAPRDVVSRAIFMEMLRTGTTNVYLDITFKPREYLEKRFPTIFKTCLKYGIDISKDYIPVAPAEHYCMGGIRTDIYGRTNIKGFYGCGEAACNGIHGANRLASNSLLEGLVFGHRIGEEVDRVLKGQSGNEVSISASYSCPRVRKSVDSRAIRAELQRIMTENVGIIRNREGLLKALNTVNRYHDLVKDMINETIEDFELQNMLLLSRLVIESALEREESRGAHYRSDFEKTDDLRWKRNIIRKRSM